MRILSLNYEFPPLGGGAGYVTQAINEQLVQKGYGVDLVTMHYPSLKDEETINGVRIFRVKSFRRKMATCETWEMASFICSAIPFTLDLTKKVQYDFIHCHFALPTGLVAYAVSKRRHLDYIVTAHGSDIPGYNPDRFKLEHKFTGPLLRTVLKKAKATVALSQHLKGLIHQNVSPSLPVCVIPNGIGANAFALDRQRNNWILMSGRLLKRKGFQHTLNALKDIPLNDWEIHLAGDGPFRQELEEIAGKMDKKIIFHGWLEKGSPELTDLYERSKIFILPSDAENASISLLEAMNAGLGIITSNTTGCRETAGDAALTVDPHDENGIKEAVLKLVRDEDLLKSLGAKARTRSLEHFNWDTIIDQYIDLYQGKL